ncbi:L-aspartate 1-decarboxylase [Paucidesulfovibrio gracilis DSM 16080]|uniref:Aspartate 1-decarboxylase n=2 Tax=Paucidesulfovibrio TaxID=2910985 RepID=A0A1T4W3N8_9BACT|nr:L-aspartate 1-decarboxylase [Paucidesulfovibrio gracilis DSM 16080]
MRMPGRCFLNAKVHGATITRANPDYHGSLSVDTRLLEAAGILPYEQVDVYNLGNGERLTTYAIPGGPGEICLNGAAALRGEAGQKVIVAAYAWLDQDEIKNHAAHVVLVDEDNNIEQVLEQRPCG